MSSPELDCDPPDRHVKRAEAEKQRLRDTLLREVGAVNAQCGIASTMADSLKDTRDALQGCCGLYDGHGNLLDLSAVALQAARNLELALEVLQTELLGATE